MTKVAILGVTGYVGRSLLHEFFLENKELPNLILTESRFQEKIVITFEVKSSIPIGSLFCNAEYNVITQHFSIPHFGIVTKDINLFMEILKQTHSWLSQLQETIDNYDKGKNNEAYRT